MSTYQSVQSASILDEALVITKPTSLAVGDLMVAGIYVTNETSGNVTITPPTDWVEEQEVDSAANGRRLYVFTKVATAGDVAASNFTFTQSANDTSFHIIGHIVRVTGHGIVNTGEAFGTANSSTTLTLTGFTPSRANCLLIAFVGVSDATATSVTSLSIATSNPTWTERVETTILDASEDSSLALYTATRPEATATGDFTITVTNPASVDSHAICIAISPTVSGSITQESKINAYAFSPIQTVVVDAIVEDPTLNERLYTGWTNEDDVLTSWTNEA